MALNRDAIRKMQDDHNQAMREVIWQVRDEMVGEPSERVYQTLLARMRKTFGNSFKANEGELRKIAKAIEEDDLTQ